MSMRPDAQMRGILYFLSGLLLVSAVVRLGLGISAAEAVPATETVSALPLSCPAPPAALMEELRLREERVATREASLATRVAALALAEDVLKARIAELETAETALTETLAQADGAAEADVMRLTAVYEAMKPKEAAALFGTMAPEFAAGFLGRMRPEAAAAVLSGMSSEEAYTVSVLLAGRNALVPRE